MAMSVRSKNLSPEQDSRRTRLIQALGKSIEEIEKNPPAADAIGSVKQDHQDGLKWLKMQLGCFKADQQLHNSNMVEFLKANDLYELFEEKDIRQLSGILETPLSRIDGYCNHAGVRFPNALRVLHLLYSRQSPKLPPRQSWIPILASDPVSESTG